MTRKYDRFATFLCVLVLSLSGCVTTTPVSDPALADSTDFSGPLFQVNQDGALIPSVPANTSIPEKKIEKVVLSSSEDDVWKRISNGMTFSKQSYPRLQSHINWYQRNQDYVDRMTERATPYLHFIVEEVERRGMPSEIALLPIVESAFQPFAYSRGRASGIWQFIPATGRLYGLKQNWWYDGRRDIYKSTHAALNYLQKLHKEFNGDWLLALAAYNSGEGTVHKAIRKNKRRGKKTDFWSLHLPRETRGYVPRLIAISQIVHDPAKYNLKFNPIKNDQYFTRVDIKGQLDLALAADMAGISMDELYRLNPAFNRWATSPKGPHKLLLPVDKKTGFTEKLAALPKEKRMRWIRHRIRQGDTLGQIAEKYHTTASVIRRSNKIRGNMIRAGRNLIIPVASKSRGRYALSVGQRLASVQHTPRSGHKIFHTVRRGDTLWDISMLYKVSVHRLAKWNAMATRDTLRLGQRLVIWTKIRKVSLLQTPSRHSGVQQVIRYVVRKGDSLARIASRFKVSVAQLLRWNSLKRYKHIQPGQRLKLFVDVTRQSS